MSTATTRHKPIYEYAELIRKDWGKVSIYAKPYLDAMARLDQISEDFEMDSAKSVVRYFICNAGQWKGPVARRIKLELKELSK
jgi:hypothetical protein